MLPTHSTPDALLQDVLYAAIASTCSMQDAAVNVLSALYPSQRVTRTPAGAVAWDAPRNMDASSPLNEALRAVAQRLMDEALAAGVDCMRYGPPSLQGAAALPRCALVEARFACKRCAGGLLAPSGAPVQIRHLPAYSGFVSRYPPQNARPCCVPVRM